MSHFPCHGRTHVVCLATPDASIEDWLCTACRTLSQTKKSPRWGAHAMSKASRTASHLVPKTTARDSIFGGIQNLHSHLLQLFGDRQSTIALHPCCRRELACCIHLRVWSCRAFHCEESRQSKRKGVRELTPFTLASTTSGSSAHRRRWASAAAPNFRPPGLVSLQDAGRCHRVNKCNCVRPKYSDTEDFQTQLAAIRLDHARGRSSGVLIVIQIGRAKADAGAE